jgi:hypothetical protein
MRTDIFVYKTIRRPEELPMTREELVAGNMPRSKPHDKKIVFLGISMHRPRSRSKPITAAEPATAKDSITSAPRTPW